VSGAVTVRLYLGGQLVDEQEVHVGADGASDVLAYLGELHGGFVEAAAVPYMVEFVFPDGQHVRWGTDTDGMVLPIPVDDLAEALRRLL
jgi:hypothetical protein